MRRFVLIIAAVLLAFLCAQARGKQAEDASAPRNLTGAVFDQDGHAAPSAVVYLENTRSLAISTYITGGDGSYRFNNLLPDIEYRVRAQSGGHKSRVKSLSAYSARTQEHVNLNLGK